jgi:hypothetical protein
MSFVNRYLPYFRQWIITYPLLALLPFQPLFTESWWISAPCPSPFLWYAFGNSVPLLCVSFQFLVYCSGFFFFVGVSLPRGLCRFILAVAGGKVHDSGCSPDGLLNVSQAGLKLASVAQQPSCFLIVMWYGEAFHGLGVQDVKVLILLVALFLPSVAAVSQGGFGVSELTLSASAP